MNSEKFISILRRMIEANDLRGHHGEDTVGVLMKCGASHDLPDDNGATLVELANAIDKPRTCLHADCNAVWMPGILAGPNPVPRYCDKHDGDPNL